MSDLHVIFGTGPLGRYTAEALLEKGAQVRLINRSGHMEEPPAGAVVIKADATNFSESLPFVQGATAIYQCAQPAYHRWREEFPPLQDAIIRLAAESKAKFIAPENLYLYGNTHGEPMTEHTPLNPCSKKGEVRAQMTKTVFAAHARGEIRAATVRGSDFFGPWEPINGAMLFKAALQRKTLNMLGDLHQPHTFTYVKDFGRALAIAGTEDRALGHTWHVPSGKPYSQNQLTELISKELGYPLKNRASGKMVLSVLGLFNKAAKEMVEMLYEFNEPFIMDATTMEKTFGLQPTPMQQRIRETLQWAKNSLN
jgi:nucleoside-diphosphate-sugar epimerase